jgi:Ca-activated chloride channel family protein
MMARLAALVLLLAFQFKLSVDVKMVEIYASVFDSKGRSVENLRSTDFEVLEDGARQNLEVFEPQSSESNIAILLDTTGSMEYQLPKVKIAIADLLGMIAADDRVGLFSFSTRLKTLQPFTSNRSEILSALSLVRPDGGTALYDALAQLSRDLSKTGGKKVVLLFTDGLDNQSVLRLDSAASAVRRIGVPVYTIAQGDLLQDSAGLKRLKAIATETNGIAFEAHNAGDFHDIVLKIHQDLQHLYMLGYYSTNSSSNAEWRRISVRLLQHAEFKVRAKEGYLP